jgi:CubicO group peptidase (beta-lactamase class C family)
MRKWITPFLFLLCLCAAGQQKLKATGEQAPNPADSFDAYVQSGLKRWRTPGMSIVVVKDGKVVFKKGFGVQRFGSPEPFSTSTLSICASTTKAMTAVCMGILVDEGKVKWTDRVSDIYPELKLADNYANSELTVKDLFTHNTGLGNADWLWVLGNPVDTVIRRMRGIPPAYSFRSSFIYQNLMYVVAGEVIHKVSGMSWDDFIRQHIFTPLGMEHTYPNYAASAADPNHISPHFLFEDTIIRPIRYLQTNGIDAAGGVWSCADDIQKWVLCLLDSTKLGSTRLLKPETYAFLFNPESMVTPQEFYPTARLTHPHWTTYGLGWFQEDYRGNMLNFHTGSLDGAVAICGLMKDEHFGIYIFGNLDHTELRHALMYKAIDLWIYHDNSNDWSGKMYAMYKGMRDSARKREKELEAKRVTGTHPSRDLAAFAGNYSNEVFGKATISQAGDSLRLGFPNNINLALSHWHFNTFRGLFENDWMGKEWITFDLEADGAVSGFTMGDMRYRKSQ